MPLILIPITIVLVWIASICFSFSNRKLCVVTIINIVVFTLTLYMFNELEFLDFENDHKGLVKNGCNAIIAFTHSLYLLAWVLYQRNRVTTTKSVIGGILVFILLLMIVLKCTYF